MWIKMSEYYKQITDILWASNCLERWISYFKSVSLYVYCRHFEWNLNQLISFWETSLMELKWTNILMKYISLDNFDGIKIDIMFFSGVNILYKKGTLFPNVNF